MKFLTILYYANATFMLTLFHTADILSADGNRSIKLIILLYFLIHTNCVQIKELSWKKHTITIYSIASIWSVIGSGERSEKTKWVTGLHRQSLAVVGSGAGVEACHRLLVIIIIIVNNGAMCQSCPPITVLLLQTGGQHITRTTANCSSHQLISSVSCVATAGGVLEPG